MEWPGDGTHFQVKPLDLALEPVALAVSVAVDYAVVESGGFVDSVAWHQGVSEGPVHLKR